MAADVERGDLDSAGAALPAARLPRRRSYPKRRALGSVSGCDVAIRSSSSAHFPNAGFGGRVGVVRAAVRAARLAQGEPGRAGDYVQSAGRRIADSSSPGVRSPGLTLGEPAPTGWLEGHHSV